MNSGYKFYSDYKYYLVLREYVWPDTKIEPEKPTDFLIVRIRYQKPEWKDTTEPSIPRPSDR